MAKSSLISHSNLSSKMNFEFRSLVFDIRPLFFFIDTQNDFLIFFG